TLKRLVSGGLDDFYKGTLARSMASDLAAAGSPVALDDFRRHRARLVTPLALAHSAGTVYNIPPPTQGVVSLVILGILDRLEIGALDQLGTDYVHLAVEATKQAFGIRDRYVTDPAYMELTGQDLLAPRRIDELAARVSRTGAGTGGASRGPSDTIWMGVVDAE